jgi:DNA mismatch repair protein MutS
MTLIDYYLDKQTEYERKYGGKTLVLMEVGGFFEFYGVANDKEKIGDIKNVCELLNIQMTRRNKAVLENSRTNALMAGFPTHSMQRFVDVLLTNSYTIVLIEQTTPPPNPKRDITKIYSPGTYIDKVTTNDANYIVSVIITEEKCYKSGIKQYIIGLSAIDLTTGKNTIYHLYSKISDDSQMIFEEMYRFIESFAPKEIITCIQSDDSAISTFNKYINTNSRKIHNMSQKDIAPFYKISYQNEFLSRIFTDTKSLTPIEYLNMETMAITAVSYITLLQFAYEHDTRIIEKIERPNIWTSSTHLTLYNNAIYQLNVVEYKREKENSTYNSLYDVINKTNTSMGMRLLKYNLLNPIINPGEINKRYDMIEYFKERGLQTPITTHLKDIVDIERLHRKIALTTLHPAEFAGLILSYNSIKSIFTILTRTATNNIFNINPDIITNFNDYMNEYDNIFIIDELSKNTLINIVSSFFKEGVYAKIDTLNEKLINDNTKLTEIATFLSTHLDGDNPVKVVHTEKEGYYLLLTKKRFETLKKKYSNSGVYNTTVLSNNVKLTSVETDKLSNSIISTREKLKIEVRRSYIETLNRLYSKYADTLKYITSLVTEIDIINSNTLCAVEYNYTRPIIESYSEKEDNQSYVKAHSMRHPIIERLQEGSVYVDNDIELTPDNMGILLYGVNGVGKSALSKAIGLNIIMAQMGMFVPSGKFTYYPYTKIFTRIVGDDNIFKGQSSFVVEMNELRSILKHSDRNSLVLGDEVCKGTEDLSATAIVASAIKRFSTNNVNFILATHLHKLYTLDVITELSNIRFMHLDIKYDEILKEVIYGRKLKYGIGESIYGIEIAKFILDDNDFIKTATSIRNNLIDVNDSLVNPKQSGYNKDVFVDNCRICGSNVNLDVHHIIYQEEFSDMDVSKNNKNNLVVLCEKHHNDVHSNKLKIHGYEKTVEGVDKLKYDFKKSSNGDLTCNSNKKYSKYVDFIIQTYKTDYEQKNITIKNIKIDIQLQQGVIISTPTIKKILMSLY